MRVKELKPNTEYATAGGRRVRTMDTVERGWDAIRQGGTTRVVRVDKTAGEKPNPWAKNRGRQRRRGAGVVGGVVVVVANGIRVTEHYPIEELAPEGFVPTETAVDPADIKGTWEQYVEAQGHVLENKRLMLEGQAAARELDATLRRTLAEVPDVSVSVSVRPSFVLDDGTRTRHFLNEVVRATGYELETHLTVTGSETVAKVADFLAQQTDQG